MCLCVYGIIVYKFRSIVEVCENYSSCELDVRGFMIDVHNCLMDSKSNVSRKVKTSYDLK